MDDICKALLRDLAIASDSTCAAQIPPNSDQIFAVACILSQDGSIFRSLFQNLAASALLAKRPLPHVPVIHSDRTKYQCRTKV